MKVESPSEPIMGISLVNATVKDVRWGEIGIKFYLFDGFFVPLPLLLGDSWC
jgi:hypothetical protein